MGETEEHLTVPTLNEDLNDVSVLRKTVLLNDHKETW